MSDENGPHELRSHPSEDGAQTVYAVLAEVRGGVSHDLLAVYSTPVLARQFIDAQQESLRHCLIVWDVVVDRHPADPYWTPPGMAAAFHLLAELPDDALPADRGEASRTETNMLERVRRDSDDEEGPPSAEGM